MGFAYILIVVLAVTAFACLAKLAARKGVPPFDLTFSMFGAAAVLGYLLTVLNGTGWDRYTVQLGALSALAGASGAVAVFVFNYAVKIGHFGFSNGIYRMSFLIPVIFSVVFLKAGLKAETAVGIASILASILLVSWSNESFGKAGIKWFILILCAFFLSGLPRVCQTLVSRQSLDSFAYLFLSYASGFVLLLGAFLLRRRRIDPRGMYYGAIAAVAGYLGVFSTLEALRFLPPVVVFPVTLSAPILLGLLISLLLKEKIRMAGWIGIAAGVCGILILSFQVYSKP
jgi:drug/metabolite transporter (DMT)-like permease